MRPWVRWMIAHRMGYLLYPLFWILAPVSIIASTLVCLREDVIPDLLIDWRDIRDAVEVSRGE